MKSIYVLSKLTNLKQKKYRRESGREKKREKGDIVQIGEREYQSECERMKE